MAAVEGESPRDYALKAVVAESDEVHGLIDHASWQELIDVAWAWRDTVGHRRQVQNLLAAVLDRIADDVGEEPDADS